ncbi:uncharacterized protein LOC108664714 [Hyalella azteca]|uniref:Uncharacterized protein LOC108664714 n=1 Tax=Hyalella azteca TaxID=294128 RepID=A0A979FT47_HYAAZ|nr:uncharacterized protein LOC108664714 [Hyalella azteca]
MEETDSFDTAMVKHQVKYHALCDTITIRQQGFSYRVPFDSFLKRYQCLAFDFDESVELTGGNARLLLLRLKMEGWAIGSSRVFLKYYMEEHLSRLYEDHLRKVVKIQAMIRTFVQLRRIRAGRFGRSSKACSPEPVLARKVNQKAANSIANRARFNEATVEGEAARIVQLYFRRWKMRTLFQTLQIYRCDKMKQLVYFCQQVHLFNQECQARVCCLSPPVLLSKVVPQKPLSHRSLVKEHSRGRPMKLTLDHTLAIFFDTSYLCHPSRRDYRQQDDDWEGPFKSRLAAERAANMGSDSPLPSSSPVPSISSKHLMDQSQSSFNKCQNQIQSKFQNSKSNDSDEDQFKDLKEQIRLDNESWKNKNKYVMTSMESFDSVSSYKQTSLHECEEAPAGRANKELQTSFEFDKNCNVSSNNLPYTCNYNNGCGNGINNNRELVYKSKRSESREGCASNCMSTEPRDGGRDHYNRFAAVTPATKPACPVYAPFNFSYIKRQEMKPAVTVAPWQNRNKPSSHHTPQGALKEMKMKAQRQGDQSSAQAFDFQSQLRKTNYKRDSMKRSEAHRDTTITNNLNNHNNACPSFLPEIKVRPEPPLSQRTGPAKAASPASVLQRELSRESARSKEAERYRMQLKTATDAMNISPAEHKPPEDLNAMEISEQEDRQLLVVNGLDSSSEDENQENVEETFEATFTASTEEAML